MASGMSFSFLDYTRPGDANTEETRVMYGLCPKKERPRCMHTALREFTLLLEMCGGDRIDAIERSSDLGVVPYGGDLTVIVARFTALIRSLFPSDAGSFADPNVPIERAAMKALLRYIEARRISLDSHNLSRGDLKVFVDFDKAFGEFIEDLKREPAFGNVDPATILIGAPPMGVEQYAERATTASNLDVYVDARRFIKPFLNMSMADATELFDWLSSFFRATDRSLNDVENEKGRLSSKTLLRHIRLISMAKPLFAPYQHISDYLSSCILLTGKLYKRNVHLGVSLKSVVKYSNPDMARGLMEYIASLFNLYVEEAGRPPVDLTDRQPAILSAMRKEAYFVSTDNRLPASFGRTMHYLYNEYWNLSREMSDDDMGCSSLVVSGPPRALPSLPLAEEVEDQVPDGYVPFLVDSQVGYTDLDGGWRTGFIREVVYNGCLVTGYRIHDSIARKMVEIPRDNVDKDVKGKGCSRTTAGPLRAVPEDRSGGGAGGSGAGSAFEVGDRVRAGKHAGIITNTFVMAWYVLTAEAYVRGVTPVDAQYGFFPMQETTTTSSTIAYGTKVEWNNKKGTVEGTEACFEIEVESKNGTAFKIYRPKGHLRLA